MLRGTPLWWVCAPAHGSVCACVCRRVLAGAWVTPCVEPAPLSGAECAGSGEYIYMYEVTPGCPFE